MPTLLVVEDERHIRQFVSANLTARGHKVIQAESAEEGLEQMQRQTPDALLLDIKLPGMSGWDLLNIMDEDAHLHTIPVVVMTATPPHASSEDYSYDNVIERLTKPVSADMLVKAVNKIFA